MPAAAPETLTTLEATHLLNLTRRGIQTAIVRGRLHAVKHGGHWFVSVAEIERYRMFHLHTQASDRALSKSVPYRKGNGGGWLRKPRARK